MDSTPLCKRSHSSTMSNLNSHNRLSETPTLSLCGNLLSTTNGSNSSSNSNELSNSTLSSTNLSFQTNQLNSITKSPMQPIPINYDNQNLTDTDLILINSNTHALINGNEQMDNLQFYANNLNGHQLHHSIHPSLHPQIDQTQQTHFNQQLNNAQIENFNCNLGNNFISLNTDY